MKKSPAGYLVDTGVWVEVERGRLSASDRAAIIGEAPVYATPISIAELTHGAELPSDEHGRQRCRAAAQRVRDKVNMPIDGAIGEIHGKLASRLLQRGRGSTLHRV